MRRDSEIGGRGGEREGSVWYNGDSRFYHLFFDILLYTIIYYYMLLFGMISILFYQIV